MQSFAIMQVRKATATIEYLKCILIVNYNYSYHLKLSCAAWSLHSWCEQDVRPNETTEGLWHCILSVITCAKTHKIA